MDREKRETELAAQCLKLKVGGLKSKAAFEAVQNMGFQGSRRTMDRHILSVRSTGHAVSPVKRDCSHSLLNDTQMSEINSWILDQNIKHRPIGYSDVQKFIYDKFSIQVSIRTAGNVLRRLGHTIKTCQSKTSGFLKTNDELKLEYMAFILKMKRDNIFKLRDPAEIRSIDVTYTKKPPIAITTFSPKGVGKQRADSTTYQYTNAIVTMISGDGHNHTPCMLFTYDPKMAKEQKKTVRGKRIRAEFEDALERYGISEDRIVYEKSNKHYFAESPEVYERFLNHYPIAKNAVILHDGGNAFKRLKTSIFDNLGFKSHCTYPTDVHQFLSPNDNKLHGCKATWREEYYKFPNEVSASLRLMNLIDLDTEKNSKTYFQNNLFNVTKSDLNKVIGV